MRVKIKLEHLARLHQSNPKYAESLERIGKREGEWLVDIRPTALEVLVKRHTPEKLKDLHAAARKAMPRPAAKPQEWSSTIKFGIWLISGLRRAGEIGVGDTVEHSFGGFGALFKRWFKSVFKRECKCSERKAWLNQHFPYTVEGVQFL
jgi:hypothetical protein